MGVELAVEWEYLLQLARKRCNNCHMSLMQTFTLGHFDLVLHNETTIQARTQTLLNTKSEYLQEFQSLKKVQKSHLLYQEQ